MRRQDGFTLIELFMALAIVSIILAVSIPSINSYRDNAKLNTAIRELRNNMESAKSQAARRGVPVSIEFVNGGYRIFTDSDTDGELDATDQLLLRASYPTGVNVGINTFPLSAVVQNPHTGFDSRGILIRTTQGNLTLQNSRGQKRSLSVGVIGQIDLS